MRSFWHTGASRQRPHYGELPAELPHLPHKVSPYEGFLIWFLVGRGRTVTLSILGSALFIIIYMLLLTQPTWSFIALTVLLAVVLAETGRRRKK